MDREDHIIESLLEGNPLVRDAFEAEPLTEEEQTLERLYLEVLGLIPQSVEPVTPSAEAKARLMAAIRAGEAVQAPAAVAAASPVEAPTPMVRPERLPVETPAPRRGGWYLPLAAALALALLGVASLLYLRSQDTATIARLNRELDLIAEEQGRLREASSEMNALAEKFSFITSPGIEVCPLRPPTALASADGGDPEAAGSGVLYMSQGRWLVRINGLEAAVGDSVYQLWFVTDDGPVSGGVFQVAQPGAPVEMQSPTMPGPTRAVQVTLEPAGGVEAPTGPTVLFGDERMTLL